MVIPLIYKEVLKIKNRETEIKTNREIKRQSEEKEIAIVFKYIKRCSTSLLKRHTFNLKYKTIPNLPTHKTLKVWQHTQG